MISCTWQHRRLSPRCSSSCLQLAWAPAACGRLLVACEHPLESSLQAVDAASQALTQAVLLAGRLVIQQPLVPQQQVDAVLASLVHSRRQHNSGAGWQVMQSSGAVCGARAGLCTMCLVQSEGL